MLSDAALDRLRTAADLPDLSGTRYRVVGKLGCGGMGSVYSVEDSMLGRQVALKVISVDDGAGQMAARILREARIIAHLEHPGIVPVHDVGTLPDNRVFYTMKLVQGQRLDQHVGQSGKLADRLRVFQKICEAVSFAHAHNVLHRDLKPQNIMVGPFGEVLVMDWGLSKLLREAASAQLSERTVTPLAASRPGETAHGTVLGTPGYMPPEQASGDVAALDFRSDVYSLGAILRFLLSAASSERVPPALEAVSAKAMSADPGARYPNVQDLADEIAHYVDGLAVAAYPESWPVRLGRWTAKNRAWLLLIVAYLVMRTLFILWRK